LALENISFDIKKRLKETTNNILKTTEDQIIAEQEQIIKLLDTLPKLIGHSFVHAMLSRTSLIVSKEISC
jgi:hypothetical protein